ncbi:MAG: hypothetical protein ROR55_12925 [Devosia sp.]
MRRLAVALIALHLPTAAAAQAPSCMPFEITSLGGRVVVTHDQGEPGPGISDMRVGERMIGNKDGNQFGEVRWMITPLYPDHEGSPTHNLLRVFFLFDNGSMIAEGIHTPQREMHDATKVSVPNTELVILGGTGAFQRASGVIDLRPSADGNPEQLSYQVDVSCH